MKSARALAAVRELWTAREQLAERRDIAPGRVLPDAAIVNAATADPKTSAELTRLPVFGGPRQRRQAGIWLNALKRARELPESELPSKKTGGSGLPPVNRWEQRNPEAAARMQRIRPALKEIAEENNLPVENLLAPDLVRQLAWDGISGPVTVEAVDAHLAAAGARSWQRSLTAEALAEALDGAPKGTGTTDGTNGATDSSE